MCYSRTDAGDAEPQFDAGVFPEISTPRLVLRELTPADAENLFAFRRDAEEQRYNSTPMRRVSEARSLIGDLSRGYADGTMLHWAVTLRGQDRVIGLFGYSCWNRQHNRADIGYDLSRIHWGCGYAFEAMTSIIQFGFRHMFLHRIEAQTIADNARSVSLLRKLGFRLEGVRREQSLEDDGRYHDSAIYGLLAQEWSSRQPAVNTLE